MNILNKVNIAMDYQKHFAMLFWFYLDIFLLRYMFLRYILDILNKFIVNRNCF